MYDQGRGVERNYEEAARWYRRAAEQELPNAQFNLAAMYEAGFGVDQDINEAVRWYGKAAAQHHEQAKARIVLLAPRVPAAADALEQPDVAVSDVADTAEPSVEPVPSAQPVVPVVELPAPSEVAAMTQEEATAEKEKVAIAALRPEEPAAEPPSQSQAVAPAVAPVNAPTAVPVVAPVVAVAVTPAVPVAVAAAYRAQLAAYRSQARSLDGWSAMVAAYPTQFEGYEPSIERIDLGGQKGVFFRLMTGSFTTVAEARVFCTRIVRAGAASGCIPRKMP